MRDVTSYPLSPKQCKEVEEYMNNHNVSENEARYMLGFIPLDMQQVSMLEAYTMVRAENPNVKLDKETLDFYCMEMIKKCIPKPNPKLLKEWLLDLFSSFSSSCKSPL